jgi:hypothetical protein
VKDASEGCVTDEAPSQSFIAKKTTNASPRTTESNTSKMFREALTNWSMNLFKKVLQKRKYANTGN